MLFARPSCTVYRWSEDNTKINLDSEDITPDQSTQGDNTQTFRE